MLIVDALDEAGDQAARIAADVLVPLALEACVIVATRDSGIGTDGLVARLAPVELIDLGGPEWQASGRADLRAFVRERLAGLADPDRLTELVLAVDPSFLLADRLTMRLRAAPDAADVHTSLGAVLGDDLDAVVLPAGRILPAGITPGALARHLLATLAWSYGAGFPEQEWIVTAGATGPAGVRVGRDDLRWLFDQLGHYILQDAVAGTATYRLAHATLADLLGRPGRILDDPMGAAVAAVLIDRHRRLADAGIPVQHSHYLWEHGWQHAVEAGGAALAALRDLADAVPAMRPRAGLAELERGAAMRTSGRRHAAVTHAERAALILAEIPGDSLSEAVALSNLGAAYRAVGRVRDAAEVTRRAVSLLRGHHGTAHAGDLPSVLSNLAAYQADLGAPALATAAGDEAVRLFRDLTASASAFRPELAMALTNLSIARRSDGEPGPALEAALESVSILRETGPNVSLAAACLNLSRCLHELDRQAEACASAREAVELYRRCAAADRALEPELAVALTALGSRLLSTGAAAEASDVVEEAIDIHRGSACEEPSLAAHEGRAWTVLATAEQAQGRGRAALHAAQQAAELLKPHGAGLANALAVLAECRLEAGETDVAEDVARRAVAIDDSSVSARRSLIAVLRGTRRAEASQELVALLRAQVVARPVRRLLLAGALLNAGIAQHDAGRTGDAAASLAEAVDLHRRLATGRAGLQRLADALQKAGLVLSEVPGRTGEAVTAGEEAVERRRDLGDRASLAQALHALAWVRFRAAGPQTALAHAEEAAAISREVGDPVGLAETLSTLGQLYAAAGRKASAGTALREAVSRYEDLLAGDRGLLDDLGQALGAYERIAGPDATDAAWSRLIALHPVHGILSRTSQATAGDPRAASWLSGLMDRAEVSRTAVAILHAQARRHRAVAPAAFDLAWGSAPGWLTVDPDLVAAARRWTIDDSPDGLRACPELLTDAGDIAAREALLELTPADEAELAATRAEAKLFGPDRAYLRRRCRDLAGRFVLAGPAGKRALLSHALLQRPECRDIIARDSLSGALLDLHDHGHAAPVLDVLSGPAPNPALLRALADHAARDDRLIGPAARVAAAFAGTHTGRLTADVLEALARVARGEPAATGTLPGRAEPDEMRILLRTAAAVATRHPAALKVLTALLAQD